MALKQTLALSATKHFPSTLGHSPPRILPYITHLPFSSNCNLRLKCSVEYHYNQAVKHSKPAEIPWSKELCNTVHLIGNVGIPIQITHLSSGKVVASTRLAVRKSASQTSWINLTFWDELAEVASQHVEKGHQIYVSGRLMSDVVETDDGKQQTYYKVVVQQLNFIERGSSLPAPHDRDPSVKMTGTRLGHRAANGTNPNLELWQAFFANPLEWWDNRNNKRNPKYPDFKHKDTGEALWVEGRNNPPWVKSQLAILDERMGSVREQDNRMQLSPLVSDDFTSF